jgi:hypothetical protein
MPNRTQYIRNEDVAAWDALDNKSQWIHEHLQAYKPDLYLVPPKVARKHPELVKQVEKALEPHVKATRVEKEMTLCKNGHAIPVGRSKCLGRGCKYSK